MPSALLGGMAHGSGALPLLTNALTASASSGEVLEVYLRVARSLLHGQGDRGLGFVHLRSGSSGSGGVGALALPAAAAAARATSPPRQHLAACLAALTQARALGLPPQRRLTRHRPPRRPVGGVGALGFRGRGYGRPARRPPVSRGIRLGLSLQQGRMDGP
jgi:hypothetical protein